MLHKCAIVIIMINIIIVRDSYHSDSVNISSTITRPCPICKDKAILRPYLEGRRCSVSTDLCNW